MIKIKLIVSIGNWPDNEKWVLPIRMETDG